MPKLFVFNAVFSKPDGVVSSVLGYQAADRIEEARGAFIKKAMDAKPEFQLTQCLEMEVPEEALRQALNEGANDPDQDWW